MDEDLIKKLESEIKDVTAQKSALEREQDRLESVLSNLRQQLRFAKTVQVEQHDWSKEFAWDARMEEMKLAVFGIDAPFRPNQRECINASLSNRDCFVVMATGSGKSLCFQMVAMLCDGFTVVVSPLLSLIKDQVTALKALKIDAVSVTSTTSKEDIKATYTNMVSSKTLKFIYVTPERIAKSKMFMNKLQLAYSLGRLARIAIDEVHCCSQWGHDFRPDYKKMDILKCQFPKVPFLCLTATATPRVVSDVKKILQLSSDLVFLRGRFNRPNLFYDIRQKSSNAKEVVDEIAQFIRQYYPDQCGIIFCFSKKDTETLAEDLRKKGLSTDCYHAGMTNEERDLVHTKWVNNKVKIITATIAFGMGIDKKDVRFVIHQTLSKSMECYYQETGRAGRDGKDSHCVLFYRAGDVTRMSTMAFESGKEGLMNFYEMVKYCESSDKCRRVALAEHFQEEFQAKDCNAKCNFCLANSALVRKRVTIDVTAEARVVLEIHQTLASKNNEKVTLKMLCDGMMKHETFKKSKFTYVDYERLVVRLLLENVFEEYFHGTLYRYISYIVAGYRVTALKAGAFKITMDFVMTSEERKKYEEESKKKRKQSLEIADSSEDDVMPVTKKRKDQRAKKQSMEAELIEDDFGFDEEEMERISAIGRSNSGTAIDLTDEQLGAEYKRAMSDDHEYHLIESDEEVAPRSPHSTDLLYLSDSYVENWENALIESKDEKTLRKIGIDLSDSNVFVSSNNSNSHARSNESSGRQSSPNSNNNNNSNGLRRSPVAPEQTI